MALVEKLGPVASWPLDLGATVSPTGHAHYFNQHGATVISGLVVDEMIAAHLPAAAFLRHPASDGEGRAKPPTVAAFTSAHLPAEADRD